MPAVFNLQLLIANCQLLILAAASKGQGTMNDDFKISISAPADPELPTMGMSSVYRLFEAFIQLREKNERQHKLFEQTLNRARDGLQSSFNTFAGDTQKAYQQLRQDVQGEKRFSLS